MTDELVIVTTGYSYTWFWLAADPAGSLSVEESSPGGAQGVLEFLYWSWCFIVILSAYEEFLTILIDGTDPSVALFPVWKARQAVNKLHNMKIRMVAFTYQQQIFATQVIVVILQFINFLMSLYDR